MDGPYADTRERVRWSLRHYFPLLLALMITGPIVAVAFGRRAGAEYRATALVVATSLTLKQEQLPRFGEAVFTSGAVANAVAVYMGIRTPPSRLIPDQISVVPLSDTVLFQVQGTAKGARESAQLANIAAAAFVKELNKAGRGVGTFALQHAANRPHKPISPGASFAALVAIGLLAGLVLGLGVVALLVSVRRPVVTDFEAAEIASVPILASLSFGRASDAAQEVGGLSRLARGIFRNRNEQCAILGSPGARGAVRRVSTLLAHHVDAPRVQVNGSSPPEDRFPLVLEGPILDAGSDVPASAFAADRRVLIVTKGIPERKLKLCSRQFGPDELDGIVFVSMRAISPRRKK